MAKTDTQEANREGCEPCRDSSKMLEDSLANLISQTFSIGSAMCQATSRLAVGSLRIFTEGVLDINDAVTREWREVKEDGEKQSGSGGKVLDRFSKTLSSVTDTVGHAADESAKVIQEAGEVFRTSHGTGKDQPSSK